MTGREGIVFAGDDGDLLYRDEDNAEDLFGSRHFARQSDDILPPAIENIGIKNRKPYEVQPDIKTILSNFLPKEY